MIISINERGSITLPATLRKELSIQTGDNLEVFVENGNIVLIPVEIIPKRIMLTQQGKQKELAAQKEINTGKITSFDTVTDLIEDLQH